MYAGDLREAAVELGVLLHHQLGASSRRISSSEREIVSVAMIGSFA